jgi:16S rRNA (cytosine1402-N4)-methyltransferase
VLLAEVVDWLAPVPGAVIADGTLGGGGHTSALAERVAPGGKVIALDRDPTAIAAVKESLVSEQIRMVHRNFADLPEVLAELGIEKVNGVILDLGISSDQLTDADRGFSFRSQGPLDLRFDPLHGEPAWKLLERLSAEHLADVIYQYGEERYSRRIARAIVQRRSKGEAVKTAADLAQLVQRCVPQRGRRERIHPATRTFQALRIAVNDELTVLDTALRRIPDCLSDGGRMAVISFHSLEDRRVKTAFREDERLRVLTKRPVRPSEDELKHNPRARSAKMRVAERTTEVV